MGLRNLLKNWFEQLIPNGEGIVLPSSDLSSIRGNNFVLPKSFDVSKVAFTDYLTFHPEDHDDGHPAYVSYYGDYYSNYVKDAFEFWGKAKDGKVLLTLPQIALLRGFDKKFSSMLWKDGHGDWGYCHPVSEWLAMPPKSSKERMRVVVSHGLKGYFFKDSSRMPLKGIGSLSEEAFDEAFEKSLRFNDFRKNGVGSFSNFSVGLEGGDAEMLLKLNGRYSLKDLTETPVDVLFGNFQVLEKYFGTAKNNSENLSDAGYNILKNLEHNQDKDYLKLLKNLDFNPETESVFFNNLTNGQKRKWDKYMDKRNDYIDRKLSQMEGDIIIHINFEMPPADKACGRVLVAGGNGGIYDSNFECYANVGRFMGVGSDVITKLETACGI